MRRLGFSLIEAVVVVSILAIIAIIAVPSYQSYKLRARLASVMNIVTGSIAQQMAVYARTGNFTSVSYLGPSPVTLPGNVTLYYADSQGPYFTPATCKNTLILTTAGNVDGTGNGAVGSGSVFTVYNVLLDIKGVIKQYCLYQVFQTPSMYEYHGNLVNSCSNILDPEGLALWESLPTIANSC